MTSIPSSFDRVPTRLASQLTRQGIDSANSQLLRAQVQLSANKRVLRPSDDPIAASLINVLDQRLQTASQRERNLQHAASVLGTLDQSLEQLNESLQEAKEIASAQVGVGSDEVTRRSQAVVVQSLIDSVYATLNRDYAGLHIYGGTATADQPIQNFYGGFRYVGEGAGMNTDLTSSIGFPITIGADTAIGALSARQKGNVDLNPQLTGDTRITDLRGPSGPITELSTIAITIDDGVTPVTIDVDLSHAKSISDVTNAIESSIRAASPAALTGVFPSAVGTTGERLAFLLDTGYSLTFSDGPAGNTATQLGLTGFTYDDSNPAHADPLALLNPKITDRTTLASLNPSTPLTYGDIVFRNGGRTGTVTTSAGMNIAEFKEAVARLNLGIRLETDESGNSLNIINEVSGFNMSVEETGGGQVATNLGLRTLSLTTSLSDFNHGRGVQIAHGNINPVSGLPDANRNTDFRIALADGSTFDVDLIPDDLNSVADTLAAINAAAATAGFGAVFSAQLTASGNGIEFQDTTGGPGQTRVTSLNAYAARDLGLLDATFTPGAPARLVSSDRATVRVDSALSALIELRQALESNDSIGITFAGEQLEAGAELAIRARSLVGARASRISTAQDRLVDTTLLDQTIKSDLQDLDYIEASTRFNLLQTQLQAGLQSAAAIRSLSLLNYLG